MLLDVSEQERIPRVLLFGLDCSWIQGYSKKEIQLFKFGRGSSVLDAAPIYAIKPRTPLFDEF